MVAIGKHCCRSLLSFAMDPEDRHLRGNSFFMYRQLFFTCAFHGPPSGIQVSLTHSLFPPPPCSVDHMSKSRNHMLRTAGGDVFRFPRLGPPMASRLTAHCVHKFLHIEVSSTLETRVKKSATLVGKYCLAPFTFLN